MNYMKQVAEMLGVVLGEKFKINFHGDISSDEYYIDETTIHEVCDGRVNDYCYPLLIALLNGTDTVVKLPKSILTEKEKEYLSAVIKPFRDRVEKIYKFRYTYSSSECIAISIKDDNNVYLPSFERGTMYKGMELEKAYTLEELGLWNQQERCLKNWDIA